MAMKEFDDAALSGCRRRAVKHDTVNTVTLSQGDRHTAVHVTHEIGSATVKDGFDATLSARSIRAILPRTRASGRIWDICPPDICPRT